MIMATTEIIINSFALFCLAAAVLLLLVVLYKVAVSVGSLILYYFFPSLFNKISAVDERCSQELLEEMDAPEFDEPDECLVTYRTATVSGEEKVTHRKPRAGNGKWFVLYVLMAKEKWPEPNDTMANRRSIAKYLAEVMAADKVTVKERASVIPVAVEMVLVPSEAELFAKKFRASKAANNKLDLASRPWWSSWWAVGRPAPSSA